MSSGPPLKRDDPHYEGPKPFSASQLLRKLDVAKLQPSNSQNNNSSLALKQNSESKGLFGSSIIQSTNPLLLKSSSSSKEKPQRSVAVLKTPSKVSEDTSRQHFGDSFQRSHSHFVSYSGPTKLKDVIIELENAPRADYVTLLTSPLNNNNTEKKAPQSQQQKQKNSDESPSNYPQIANDKKHNSKNQPHVTAAKKAPESPKKDPQKNQPPSKTPPKKDPPKKPPPAKQPSKPPEKPKKNPPKKDPPKKKPPAKKSPKPPDKPKNKDSPKSGKAAKPKPTPKAAPSKKPPKPKDNKKKGGCCGCCKKNKKKPEDPAKPKDPCVETAKDRCLNPLCLISWIVFIIGLSLWLSLFFGECDNVKINMQLDSDPQQQYLLTTYSYITLVLLFCLFFIALTKLPVRRKGWICVKNIIMAVHLIMGAAIAIAIYFWIRDNSGSNKCLLSCLLYTIIMMVLGVLPFIVFSIVLRKRIKCVNPQKTPRRFGAMPCIPASLHPPRKSRLAISNPCADLINRKLEKFYKNCETSSTKFNNSTANFNYENEKSNCMDFRNSNARATSRDRDSSPESTPGVFVNFINVRVF